MNASCPAVSMRNAKDLGTRLLVAGDVTWIPARAPTCWLVMICSVNLRKSASSGLFVARPTFPQMLEMVKRARRLQNRRLGAPPRIGWGRHLGFASPESISPGRSIETGGTDSGRAAARLRLAHILSVTGENPPPLPYLRRVACVALPWLLPVVLARDGGGCQFPKRLP